MKRFAVCLAAVTCLAVLAMPARVNADTSSLQTLHEILQEMSIHLDRMETLGKQLESSGRNNAAYDDYKNIWLSTLMALSVTTAIYEYENDQLTLFLDLRESRRRYFFDIRIASLENSAKQIRLMQQQIRINHSLLPLALAEAHLINRLNDTQDKAVLLLDRARFAIEQVAGKKP